MMGADGQWQMAHLPIAATLEPDLQVIGAAALVMTSLSVVATSAPFQSPFYHSQRAGAAPSAPPP